MTGSSWLNQMQYKRVKHPSAQISGKSLSESFSYLNPIKQMQSDQSGNKSNIQATESLLPPLPMEALNMN